MHISETAFCQINDKLVRGLPSLYLDGYVCSLIYNYKTYLSEEVTGLSLKYATNTFKLEKSNNFQTNHAILLQSFFLVDIFVRQHAGFDITTFSLH